MLILLDKVIIFLLCFLPYFGKNLSAADIYGVLGAVIISCLCQALIPDRTPKNAISPKKIIKTAAEGIFSLLCIFSPALLPFLPLTVYEGVRTKDLAPLVFGGIALVSALAQAPFSCLYPLILCLLAAYSCVKTLKNRELSEKNNRNRDDSAELQRIMSRRNRELKENLDYEVHITALNERNRIAREIHDNVGHLLSRSLLQTGALSAICPKDQKAMKEAIDGLKDTLDSAMNSIRESVHGIRDDSLDLKTEGEKILAPLSERFSAAFDCDIGEDMPSKIKLCFISIMKEAVSNITRHSNGKNAKITLREHPSLYQLVIYDDGTANYAGEITEGMGLNNMRERAESAGGYFRISREGGFTVFVSVRKTDT
ncbi:MAG: sensor histidine kinase [Ruminiclostridium sp.]|nr:sensor histidine kinase [Ruminiclostridium sp.]